MTHPNALLENLTSSSLRLNKGLMVLSGLALLLVGVSYWGVLRMIEEQHDTVRFHFARLMENIHEQEAFLNAVAKQSAEGELQAIPLPKMFLQKPLPDEGPNVYLGQEFSISLPFSVKTNPAKPPAQQAKVFGLGANLASYFSAFWSASHYQSPQVFLFNVQDKFDICVPAVGQLRGAGQIQGGEFNEVITRVRQRLQEKNPTPLDDQVHWESYPANSDENAPTSILAYINISPKTGPQSAPLWVMLASLLNLSQVNNIERIMHWSIYDHFTLIAPSGQALVGSLKPEFVLKEGLNFNSDGLVFKISSAEEKHWTAIYVISFKSFLDYALWPLLILLALLLTGLGCGWVFNRWYKAQVVLPAQRAHEHIAESEAFSRALIDTAPTGLCVVRRNDHKILLKNQRAQQWQDASQLIAALSQQQEPTKVGQTDLQVDGHYLHVGFICTRYQGQDVWLCAINDVTRHIEDAAALEEARQVADSANQAKTRFLATMSHEIRTPLYGVLGTLELLGLTTLEPRQQAYLQTIQRSSATLFQLISDVLDVSKIESGQMTLDIQDFCPLELTEETLRTYSASAQAKGLQLYACIDSTVPNRVRGDPLRIRQILNNLVSNAIKFTENGRVVLRLRVTADKGESVSLEWQVSDSGIGISQTQQVQLFDPFYQVRDASSEAGAGLGLAICWWLCELMDGHLKVVSEPGLGSSFSLHLTLDCLPGELGDCPAFPPGTSLVYVRTPTLELTQSICAWLNRLGADAKPFSQEMKQTVASTLLMDVLPTGNDVPWHGPQVIANAGGPSQPERSHQGWEVDAHDIRAMASAVYLGQHGASAHSHPLLPEKVRRLNLRILVAEDNPINQEIIREQLEELGCSVVLAAHGEQALNQWLPGAFDLVMTDINMPIMNGYELTKALRQQDPHIPIIGVTANALREEGERCAAVGMNAWIVKPLNLQMLRDQLLKHCKVATPAPASYVAERPVPATLQLSPKMRELFIITMQQDMQLCYDALDRADADTLAQRLHSIAGALGAVQVSTLAKTCATLESRLTGLSITPALAQEVRHSLECMRDLLETLE